MAILENEIWITLSSKLTKHFENKGYEIPRKRDKWGSLTVPRGTEILVKVEDLPTGSHIELTEICDNENCDIEGGRYTKNQQYRAILIARERNDGKDLCSKCSYSKRGKTRKENVKYENSLEYFALNNNKEYLLNEFSKNNKKNPKQISSGTHDKYLWNCFVCGKIDYSMSVANRTRLNQNCPECAGNIKKTTEQYKQEVIDLVGDEYSVIGNYINSRTPIEMKHEICGNSYGVSPNNFLRERRCPVCSESKGEQRIRKYLDENKFEFVSQKEFDGLIGIRRKNLSYDFFLPNENILIEYQGEFHDGSNGNYTKVNLDNQQEHDERKREFAIINNINLIEIWYWDFDNIEKILNSKIK